MLRMTGRKREGERKTRKKKSNKKKKINPNLTEAGFGSRCESCVNIDRERASPPPLKSPGLLQLAHKKALAKAPMNRAATII